MATLKDRITKSVEAFDKAQTVKAATTKVSAAIAIAAKAAEISRKLIAQNSQK